MSVEQALGTRLKAHAAITAAVGDRVFFEHAPTNAKLPLIVFQRVGGTPHHHTTNAAGVAEQTWQFDVYAKSTTARAAGEEAIRNCLDGWAGTASGVRFQSITLDPPVHSTEGENKGRETKDFRARVDGTVFVEVAAPTH